MLLPITLAATIALHQDYARGENFKDFVALLCVTYSFPITQTGHCLLQVQVDHYPNCGLHVLEMAYP